MAVYYFDPLKSAAGTGTFANPYGLFSSTVPNLNSGDEARLISTPLTTLLTATEYTVTVRDFTASGVGAGLSALTGGSYLDLPAGKIVYFPDYDVFMRLGAAFNSSGLYLATTFNSIPIPVMVKTTGVRMRLVDDTKIVNSATNTCKFTASNIAGVTFTDGWVADGVRVTDGSAKSIITSSSAGNLVFYLTTGVLGPTSISSLNTAPNTADLNNTHVISGLGTVYSSYLYMLDTYNTTISINQVYTYGTYNSYLQGNGGNGVLYGSNVTLNIKNFNTYTVLYQGLNPKTTINIDKLFCYNFPSISSNPVFNAYAPKCVFNFNSVFLYNSFAPTVGQDDIVINFNGAVSKCGSVQLSYLQSSTGGGESKINYNSGFSFVAGYASTPTTQTSASLISITGVEPIGKVRTFKNCKYPTGWTINESAMAVSGSTSNTTKAVGKLFSSVKYVFKDFAQLPPMTMPIYPNSVNRSFVDAAGLLEPYEVLGLINSASLTSCTAATLFKLTTDSSKYAATSESAMRFELTTYSNQWKPAILGVPARAIKNVAIPCVAGAHLTIAGKFETSDSSYAVGDFEITVVDQFGVDLVTPVNPSTASINNRTGFLLGVDPTYTGEVYLTFSMTGYRGGQTYWVSALEAY